MTDTPKTDQAQIEGNFKNQLGAEKDWPWSAIHRGYDFARKLERERNQLLKALEFIIEVGTEFYDMDCGEVGSEAIQQARFAILEAKKN